MVDIQSTIFSFQMLRYTVVFIDEYGALARIARSIYPFQIRFEFSLPMPCVKKIEQDGVCV